MHSKNFIKELASEDFALDELGRLVIGNSDLLQAISGATFANSMLNEVDAVCGNNATCSNSNCCLF